MLLKILRSGANLIAHKTPRQNFNKFWILKLVAPEIKLEKSKRKDKKQYQRRAAHADVAIVPYAELHAIRKRHKRQASH